MNKKFFFRLCIVVAGIFLPFFVGQAQEQQMQQPEVAAVEEQDQQEDTFKFEESIVDDLEGRIPDGKFEQVGELKGKEFSESGLSEALQAIAFSDKEIETVLNLVHEHQQFVGAIKKAAPIALAMEEIQAGIQTQEDVLEKTHQEDEKKKISRELGVQRRELKKHESRLADIMKGIEALNAEQINEVLKDAGRENDEIEIISRSVVNHALFAKKIGTLSEMSESIEAINKEISEYEKKLKNAGSDEQKKTHSAYLAELNDRLKKTKNDFSLLTTGIDYTTFLKKEGKEVNWEKELKEIFSPIIVELKETTERPRRMEQLRSQMLYLEKRIPQVQQASEDIDKLLGKVTDEKVRARLESWKEYWTQLEKEFITQNEAAQNQLLKEKNESKSLLASFRIFFDSFVKHRGKNLFFALLAFICIYLMLSLLQRLIRKYSPIHRSPKYMFWANLVDVTFYALTFLVATGALVAVLFTSGDWLILAIVMLLVLGIIWGARNTLPQFIEQIKLLLGFGPVRQGERVKIDGIPYRVEMMGVYSYLKNPLLTGGTLRLPLKDLVGMRSRPYDEEELWFPTRIGDWIRLSDGYYGKIEGQTPDIVLLNTLRGSYKSYTPKDFLQQRPQNLSINLFSVNNILNLDFQHSDSVLDDIPKKVEDMLRESIEQQFYGKYLTRLIVELKTFDNSSLNVITIAQFSGEAASEYTEIGWLLQQVALAACNKYGWKISLNQVMLHQANPYELMHTNCFSEANTVPTR
jgi:hypothetical protein